MVVYTFFWSINLSSFRQQNLSDNAKGTSMGISYIGRTSDIRYVSSGFGPGSGFLLPFSSRFFSRRANLRSI